MTKTDAQRDRSPKHNFVLPSWGQRA